MFMLGSFCIFNLHLVIMSNTINNVAKLWCLGNVDVFFLVLHFSKQFVLVSMI